MENRFGFFDSSRTHTVVSVELHHRQHDADDVTRRYHGAGLAAETVTAIGNAGPRDTDQRYVRWSSRATLIFASIVKIFAQGIYLDVIKPKRRLYDYEASRSTE